MKVWVDTKIYEKAADLKMVFRNSLSCKYIPSKEYKGACMLKTMTNTIGCEWGQTMK